MNDDNFIDYTIDLSTVENSDFANVTNNVYINSILWGGYKWTNHTIAYSFWGPGTESFDDYHGNTANQAYFWQGYEIDAFEQALAIWEAVANIDFVRIADNNPNSTLGFYSVDSNAFDSSITLGRFHPPGEVGEGTGYFNWEGSGWDFSGLEQGGLGFVTILHEIGHGLGLAHPHDDGGNSSRFPGVTYSGDLGTYNLNQGIWTIMSYNDGWNGDYISSNYYGLAGTPMAFDIAAIQYLYGANLNYATGNNIYRLPTSNGSGTYYSAIWDAGGVDIISAEGAFSDVAINLNEAPLIGPNAGGYLSAVAGVAGGFTIANNVTIENAIGGFGDDTITGNTAHNNLTGNEGDDILFGDSGNDILIGSNPNSYGSGSGEYDQLTGGVGADIFVLGDFYEAYYQGFGHATITDFNWVEGDKIQVFGFANDYSLDTFNGGIDILYQGDLIGYVSNTTDVLISADFIFV